MFCAIEVTAPSIGTPFSGTYSEGYAPVVQVRHPPIRWTIATPQAFRKETCIVRTVRRLSLLEPSRL